MMRVSSRRSVKEAPRITQNASSDVSFSPSFLWHLLMHFAEYRMELPIREVMVFPNGHAYYVCPRCNITRNGNSCPTATAVANTWVGIVTEKLRLSIPVTEKKYIPNDAQGWTFALHPCLFSIFLFDAYKRGGK